MRQLGKILKTPLFLLVAKALVDRIPDHFQLILKPHPNSFVQFPSEIRALRRACQKKENLFFLDDFPPIYPLLDYSDIYLGDHSSVGYDALSFQRPMFFLNPNDKKRGKALFLFRCGRKMDLQNCHTIYEQIERGL